MATNQEKDRDRNADEGSMQQKGRSGDTEKSAGTRRDDDRSQSTRSASDEDDENTRDENKGGKGNQGGGNRGGNR